MIKLDFHSPANVESIGYGSMFFGIRRALERVLPEFPTFTLADNYTGGDIQVYVGTPWPEMKEYYERKSDLQLIFTMFEGATVPNQYLDIIKGFDGVITPSEWGNENFRQNGIELPMWVIPLGIDPERWKLIDRKIKGKDETFNIFWQGTAFGGRKGGPMVKEIFEEMNLPNSKLTLKINPAYTGHKTEWDFPLKLDGSIRSIGRTLPFKDLVELIGTMDLSVYPSMGEGFGLIPMEHMATGLPVVLADNSGMSQFCNPAFNMPVKCHDSLSTYGTAENSTIKRMNILTPPDKSEVRSMIEWAYENRQEAHYMGQAAAEWVKQNWTYDKTARKLLKSLEEIYNGKMGRVAKEECPRV